MVLSEPVYTLTGVVRGSQESFEDFTGPIDLILLLLSKHKIEIRDIKISELLEQYLESLEEMKRMDLEIASEFIAMASHLVYLKSRMLLSLSDEQTVSEMDLLLQAIEQRRREEDYRRIQFGCEFLSGREQQLGQVFMRLPERIERDHSYSGEHRSEELADALFSLSDRLKRRSPPQLEAFVGIVGRETHSLKDMISLVVQRLKRKGKTSLSRLLRFATGRAERVTVFLAVLELCRSRQVKLQDTQDDYELDLAPDAPDMVEI